jgi:hypothetical protein
LYIVAIVGLVISIIAGFPIRLFEMLSTFEGSLYLSDFIFFIVARLVFSLGYFVPQILLIVNCKKLVKKYNTTDEKMCDYKDLKSVRNELKQMSLKLFSVWFIVFFIAMLRLIIEFID